MAGCKHLSIFPLKKRLEKQQTRKCMYTAGSETGLHPLWLLRWKKNQKNSNSVWQSKDILVRGCQAGATMAAIPRLFLKGHRGVHNGNEISWFVYKRPLQSKPSTWALSRAIGEKDYPMLGCLSQLSPHPQCCASGWWDNWRLRTSSPWTVII